MPFRQHSTTVGESFAESAISVLASTRAKPALLSFWLLLPLFALLMILGGCSLTSVKADDSGTTENLVREIKYDDMLTVVTASPLPVFLEEYDPATCRSKCLDQHKVVDNLARRYKGKVQFFRVVTDESEFASGVQQPVYYVATPTLQVFDTDSGLKSEEELAAFLDAAVARMQAPVKSAEDEDDDG